MARRGRNLGKLMAGMGNLHRQKVGQAKRSVICVLSFDGGEKQDQIKRCADAI